MWKLRATCATFALGLLTAALPVAAQEATPPVTPEQPPLLEMLALVPAVPEAIAGTPFIGYIDYEAIEQAREGVPVFQNWAAFNDSLEDMDDSARLWMQNSMRIVTGPDFYLRYLRQYATMEDLVGFDVFDIDRALVLGQPPARGIILQGDFDAEAVTEAYVARDYATGQNNGVVLLNRGDGEPGLTQSLQTRDVANPFGGELGRQEPIAVTDEYILNSPNDALLDAMVNAFVGYRRSLYTAPEIAAAAEAVSIGQGQLLQALFLNPLEIAFPGIDPALLLTPNPDVEALLQPNSEFGPLPLYSAAVLADLQDGPNQVALIALVYSDEATARAAAEEVTQRIATLTPRGDDRLPSMLELTEGAQVNEPNVYFSPGTGNYVALASVSYPMPPNVYISNSTGEPLEEGDSTDNAGYPASGRLFRLWFDNLMTRSFDILTVTE
jgi:hypothetical protein